MIKSLPEVWLPFRYNSSFYILLLNQFTFKLFVTADLILLHNEVKNKLLFFPLISVKSCGPESVTGVAVRGRVPQAADIKQLEEAKETLKGQLEEISLQLERDGYSSVAQMR